MAAESRNMPQRRIVRQRVQQLVAAAQRAQRQASADSLRHHYDIGHDAEVLQREHVAGAAQAGQDLVEYEYSAGEIASFAQRADESNLGNSHAALGLHRLDDHRRD